MNNTVTQLAKKSAIGLGTAIALLTVSPSVLAATFSWSYENEFGDIYTGIIQGTRQPDGNTVVVSAVEETQFNGIPLAPTPFFFPFLLSSTVPVVSFDGELMDLIACTNAACDEDFFYFLQTPNDAPEFFATPGFGDSDETYDSAFWRLQAVPEPTSVLGILAGSAIAGLLVKRQKT